MNVSTDTLAKAQGLVPGSVPGSVVVDGVDVSPLTSKLWPRGMNAAAAQNQDGEI